MAGSGRWAHSRGLLDRAVNGNGSVVGLVGPPGIGKSRIVREIASRATDAGVEVYTTYCESHTTDVPFHAAAGLVRATTGSNGLDDAAARAQVRARFSGADDEDLLILDDLLGIGDPAATLPQIDPDARRRRLAAMVNAAALAQEHADGLRHRGCALDRRDQRVDAGGLPFRRAPDTITRHDHVPTGIRWCACACAKIANHSP